MERAQMNRIEDQVIEAVEERLVERIYQRMLQRREVIATKTP